MFHTSGTITRHNVGPNGKIITKENNGHPLFDFGHALLPDYSDVLHERNSKDIPWMMKVVSHAGLGMIAASVQKQVLISVLLVVWGRTKDFVCLCVLVGTTTVGKALSQFLTSLPTLNPTCWNGDVSRHKFQGEPGVWLVSESAGSVFGCNALLWSGQTGVVLFCLLALNKEFCRRGVPWFLRSFIYIYMTGYIFVLLVLHLHYTIDVFVAVIIAVSATTNTSLRFFVWRTANEIVGNPVSKPPGYKC